MTWRGRAKESFFIPPKWKDNRYSFSAKSSSPYTFHYSNQFSSIATSNQLKTVTNSLGKSDIVISFNGKLDPPIPFEIQVEAVVKDINQHSISGSVSFIVHPCHFYIGIKTAKQFFNVNEKSLFSLVVLDIEGNIIPFVEITIEIDQIITKYEKGLFIEEKINKEKKMINSIEDQPIEWEINIKENGYFNIKATVEDNNQNQIYSSSPFWVIGNGQSNYYFNQQNNELKIIADKEKYNVGDEISLYIQSPFLFSSSGIIFCLSEEIISSHHFTFSSPSPSSSSSSSNSSSSSSSSPSEYSTYLYKHVVTEKEIPFMNFYIEIIGTKGTENSQEKSQEEREGINIGGGNGKSERISGYIGVEISTLSRQLLIEIKPEKRIVKPNEEIEINFHVTKNDDQNPISNAEIAIIIVDEAILSLSGKTEELENFLERFYPKSSASFIRRDNRDFLLSPNDKKQQQNELNEEILMGGRYGARDFAGSFDRGFDGNLKSNNNVFRAFSMSASSAESLIISSDQMNDQNADQIKVEIRSNFNPLAFFDNILTDEKGNGKVKVKFGQSLSSFRIFAFSSFGNSFFGKNESKIEVKKKIFIKPSFPRFLNYGDEVDLSLLLINQFNHPINVNLLIRTTNHLQVISSNGILLNVLPQHPLDVYFKVKTKKVGSAKIQIFLFTDHDQEFNQNFDQEYDPDYDQDYDAIEEEIEIYSPATKEAIATYGEIDEEFSLVEQPIEELKEVFAEFGGISITISSSLIQDLIDPINFILDNENESGEQISSRLFLSTTLFSLPSSFLSSFLSSNHFSSNHFHSSDQFHFSISYYIKELQKRQNRDGGFGWWTNQNSDPFISTYIMNSLTNYRKEYIPLYGNIMNNDLELNKIDEMMISGLKYLWEIDRKFDQINNKNNNNNNNNNYDHSFGCSPYENYSPNVSSFLRAFSLVCLFIYFIYLRYFYFHYFYLLFYFYFIFILLLFSFN